MAQDTPLPIPELQKKPKTDHGPMAESLAKSIIALHDPDEMYDVMESISIIVHNYCITKANELNQSIERLIDTQILRENDIRKLNAFIDKIAIK